MRSDTEDSVIHSITARNIVAAKYAAIDAQNRSQSAWDAHPFFSNPLHQSKITAVKKIVTDFFTDYGEIYVNHRENRGRPFSVVKVAKPRWPAMSKARIDQLYRQPLAALGVEIVFSTNTNSYLYRIS